MEFPAGFDPLAVTRLILNDCHFGSDEALDDAFARFGEIFPNAKLETMLFAEDPAMCVLHFHPSQGISNEDERRMIAALKMIADQPPRGESRPDKDSEKDQVGWQQDPDAWKKG